MRAVLEVLLGLGLTCMLLSNLHDSARATSLDFPGGPLTHDEQFFLKIICEKWTNWTLNKKSIGQN